MYDSDSCILQRPLELERLFMPDTVQISIRLHGEVYKALARQAAELKPPQQLGDRINSILTLTAIKSGLLNEQVKQQLEAQQQVLKDAANKAIEMRDEGQRTEHFTLEVVRAMMAMPDIRKRYEIAIDGDAYAEGVKGKMPFNMHLCWEIKNAVGAEVQKSANGKPKRTSVRGEPIQTYTLLDPSSF